VESEALEGADVSYVKLPVESVPDVLPFVVASVAWTETE
jgi:hypothetical protein